MLLRNPHFRGGTRRLLRRIPPCRGKVAFEIYRPTIRVRFSVHLRPLRACTARNVGESTPWRHRGLLTDLWDLLFALLACCRELNQFVGKRDAFLTLSLELLPEIIERIP